MQILFITLMITSFSSIASEKQFTLKQVAEHSVAKDCWIVINERVYDISAYIPKHPAPETVLTKYCGKNADLGWKTKDKSRAHSRSAEKLLNRYEIGTFSN